jgi:hypothetical protein
VVDDDIDDCDCERLQDDLTATRTAYHEHHRRAYDDYRIGIEEVIKTGPSVMSFEDWLASGSQGICDLFGEFIERTYGDGFRRVPGRIL